MSFFIHAEERFKDDDEGVREEKLLEILMANHRHILLREGEKIIKMLKKNLALLASCDISSRETREHERE